MPRSFFHEITTRAAALDDLGQAYLQKLPFLTTEETADRLHTAAMGIFHAANEALGDVPDYVASIADGGMPYYGTPRNGSLRFILGFSCASQDAHLRNLLEIAEGRETAFLAFPVVAETPV